MDDREYWTRKRDEAERELDAAKGRTAINAASKRLQRARAELARLDAEPAERSTPRAATGTRTIQLRASWASGSAARLPTNASTSTSAWTAGRPSTSGTSDRSCTTSEVGTSGCRRTERATLDRATLYASS